MTKKEAFLKKYLTFQPGDEYRTQLANLSQTQLQGSHFFSSVVLTPQIKQKKNIKSI